jgi:hypothetical protein
MRLDNLSEELLPGRLFIHGQLNDPMTGGPLYCRILSFDGALVEYEPIYHREDGSERLGSPRRLPIGASSRKPSEVGTRGPGLHRRS